MKLIVSMGMAGLMALASAQDATPKRVVPADAKNHVGESAVICGKVVDTKVFKYGIVGHGKMVALDLDQPEPHSVFSIFAFGPEPGGAKDVIDAYKGKDVCVTGKIGVAPSGGAPHIVAADRSQIKTEAAGK
jgi:hypothetical protein